MNTSFNGRYASVVQRAAELLAIEPALREARPGPTAEAGGQPSRYVHFQHPDHPERFCVWLFGAPEGSAYSTKNRSDSIGIGLKHDPDTELAPGWADQVDGWFPRRRFIKEPFEDHARFEQVSRLADLDDEEAARRIAVEATRALRAVKLTMGR